MSGRWLVWRRYEQALAFASCNLVDYEPQRTWQAIFVNDRKWKRYAGAVEWTVLIKLSHMESNGQASPLVARVGLVRKRLP